VRSWAGSMTRRETLRSQLYRVPRNIGNLNPRQEGSSGTGSDGRTAYRVSKQLGQAGAHRREPAWDTQATSLFHTMEVRMEPWDHNSGRRARRRVATPHRRRSRPMRLVRQLRKEFGTDQGAAREAKQVGYERRIGAVLGQAG